MLCHGKPRRPPRCPTKATAYAAPVNASAALTSAGPSGRCARVTPPRGGSTAGAAAWIPASRLGCEPISQSGPRWCTHLMAAAWRSPRGPDTKATRLHVPARYLPCQSRARCCARRVTDAQNSLICAATRAVSAADSRPESAIRCTAVPPGACGSGRSPAVPRGCLAGLRSRGAAVRIWASGAPGSLAPCRSAVTAGAGHAPVDL